jgi:hypothetical protein
MHWQEDGIFHVELAGDDLDMERALDWRLLMPDELG